ncbi:MAG TPA: aminomethyl-transferring glycine dehydrogenase subunit GcvPB, partial [Acidobacteriaceae bacterium]
MASSSTATTPRPTTGKVRAHQTQNEGLLFEKSSPGKRAYKLPALDVPEVDPAALLGGLHRDNTG